MTAVAGLLQVTDGRHPPEPGEILAEVHPGQKGRIDHARQCSYIMTLHPRAHGADNVPAASSFAHCASSPGMRGGCDSARYRAGGDGFIPVHTGWIWHMRPETARKTASSPCIRGGFAVRGGLAQQVGFIPGLRGGFAELEVRGGVVGFIPMHTGRIYAFWDSQRGR